MTPVRIEPAALWSQVKHSTDKPLRSLVCFFFFLSVKRNISYHLQVLDDIKLGENDKIVFYNGDSPHEKELIILCNTCPKHHVISSTGKHLSIHMMIEKPEETMFRFRYKQGKARIFY